MNVCPLRLYSINYFPLSVLWPSRRNDKSVKTTHIVGIQNGESDNKPYRKFNTNMC